jgi:hypothetical protein
MILGEARQALRTQLNYWCYGDYRIGAGAHGKITLPREQCIRGALTGTQTHCRPKKVVVRRRGEAVSAIG